MLQARNKFLKKGELEKQYFSKVDAVVGRTDWDKAHTLEVNNNLKYYHCDEMLREIFYTAEKWNEMSFKYNLTEFCTSIKSMCFSYLFDQKKYEKGIFFDPDILIFNSLDFVFDSLTSYSIVLTPHVLNVNSISK